MDGQEYKTPERVRAKNKRWHEAHREELRAKARAYYQAHREERLASRRASEAKHRDAKVLRDHRYNMRRRTELRQAIFNLLGSRCVRCGFSDTRALTIDHIKGKGTQERKAARSMDAYYRNILVVGAEGYQVLCANCNQIKRQENRESNRKYYTVEE
jgi:predicted restriction endonuclease